MTPQVGQLRRPYTAFALAILAAAFIGGTLLASMSPAEAQLFERRQRGDGFNPFGFIFGGRPNEPRDYRWERRAPRQARPAQAEQTRPPPPQKHDTPPSKHIVVMGTSLSDWLAYGLEEIYSDQPEVGIVRKNQLFSGLVKFDAKEEQTWPQVARDFLKDQNPDVIVVMLGLEDRQTIRVKPPAPTPEQTEAQSAESTPKPEPRRRTQSFEFRSDEWAEVYSKRIDEMIAALKSKGVPVVWVGLPAIRGTRSTSDMIYLNDLFRARADRAGIVYVDVWDGFVNEAGRYSAYGPDVEGQVRRLRTSEGVYMTKFGARKLAHYVEREIKRVMGTRLQLMSVPSLDDSGQPMTTRPGGPAARPVTGPVVPLTNPVSADELLGASMRPGANDPLAARVLVKGSPVAPPTGRADNFFRTKEAAEAAEFAEKALETEEAEARALAARSQPAPGSPKSIIGDEPKANEQPERAARAASRGSDPAAPATTARRPAPPRSAERRAQQQPYRPLSQDPRLVPPRDVQPRRQRAPIFDPFGLFR